MGCKFVGKGLTHKSDEHSGPPRRMIIHNTYVPVE